MLVGRVFNEIVRHGYHQLHVVEQSDIQNYLIEMLYGKTLPHLILCAQALEQEKPDSPVYTQLCEQYMSYILRLGSDRRIQESLVYNILCGRSAKLDLMLGAV